MSISVHCEPCGKTYQLRDDMAGRKGKCPRGHTLLVPALAEPPAEAENEFAFTNGSSLAKPDEPSSAKRTRNRSERRDADDVPVAAPANDDEFAFPTGGAVGSADEEPTPKSSRYRTGARAAKEKAAGRSMIPMLVGGVVAILGVGGGLTMFFMARSEVNPLREQAAAANKKAEDAEMRAKTAEAVAAAADARLPELQKTLAARETALKAAQEKATAAEKKAAKLEREQKEAAAVSPVVGDPAAQPGKKDANAPMPAKAPDMAPKGGKNWTSPASVSFGAVSVKAGDRVWVSPKEDAMLKAQAGKLRVKFDYLVPKGKTLPADIFSTIMIVQAGSVKVYTVPVTLVGQMGDAESFIDVKGISGEGEITFCLSDGNIKGDLQNIKVFSNLVAMRADFDPPKK